MLLTLPGGKDALGAAAWIEAALKSQSVCIRWVGTPKIPYAQLPFANRPFVISRVGSIVFKLGASLCQAGSIYFLIVSI